jgi:hypothetical protein
MPIQNRQVLDYMTPEEEMQQAIELQAMAPYLADAPISSQDIQVSPELVKSSMASQKKLESGPSQLEQYIKEYQERPSGIDYSAPAALLASFQPQYKGVAELAQSQRPETQDQRARTVLDLQQKLQAQKDRLSQGEFNQLKALMGLDISKQKADAMTERSKFFGAGLDIRGAQFSQRIADVFDKDQMLKQINSQRQQMELDRHTVETAEVLTPQLFNEVQKGIANAIAGGKSASVSDTEAMKIKTIATEFAAIQQRLKNKPQDISSPEIKKYLTGVISRLADAYDANAFKRAEQLKKGRAAGLAKTPEAMSVMEEKVESYRVKPKESSEDQEAIEWAKQNRGNPDAENILKLHGVK